MTYYVLVVIELSSRKVHIAGITPGPDGPFMMQVGRNLTDPFDGFLRGKRWLILDRDKKFTTEFRDLLEHAGTDVIRSRGHNKAAIAVANKLARIVWAVSTRESEFQSVPAAA